VPYIPASSIKGAARAYAEAYNTMPCSKSPGELFGTVGETGLVMVTDAYPVKCSDKLLDLDIVTPHYKEVEGRVREVDVNPVPIVYPAVTKGVTFGFILAFRKQANAKCLSDVWGLLKGA